MASPCNYFSLMRGLPGRPPVPAVEREWTEELIDTTVSFLVEIQKRLSQRYGPACQLVIVWENPSSSDKRSLATYMQDKGHLERLKLRVLETSYCVWDPVGFPYSKPTNILTNLTDVVLIDPCRFASTSGPCPYAKSHVHTPSQLAETLYRIPSALIGMLNMPPRKFLGKSSEAKSDYGDSARFFRKTTS